MVSEGKKEPAGIYRSKWSLCPIRLLLPACRACYLCPGSLPTRPTWYGQYVKWIWEVVGFGDLFAPWFQNYFCFCISTSRSWSHFCLPPILFYFEFYFELPKYCCNFHLSRILRIKSLNCGPLNKVLQIQVSCV